jgi:hypothetical protein
MGRSDFSPPILGLRLPSTSVTPPRGLASLRRAPPGEAWCSTARSLCTAGPTRCPSPLGEAGRSPRFLGSPRVHAPFSDPGGTSGPDHPSPSVLPSAPLTASAPATQTLSGLDSAACTLPVYASPCRSPARAQHSVPAGGQPWPGGVGPRGCFEAFRCLRHRSSSQA